MIYLSPITQAVAQYQAAAKNSLPANASSSSHTHRIHGPFVIQPNHLRGIAAYQQTQTLEPDILPYQINRYL